MSDVSTSEKERAKAPHEEALERERYEMLRRLDDWLDTPMLVLAFVWLALFVYELVWGLNRPLEMAGYAIWGLFVGRDAENDEAELAGAKQLAALREEVIALRDEMRALARRRPQ